MRAGVAVGRSGKRRKFRGGVEEGESRRMKTSAVAFGHGGLTHWGSGIRRLWVWWHGTRRSRLCY